MSIETPSVRDCARKSYSLFLKRMAEVVANDIAEAMGVDKNRISDLRTKHAEDLCMLFAHAGLKLVRSDAEVVNPVALAFCEHAMTVFAKDPGALLRCDE